MKLKLKRWKMPEVVSNIIESMRIPLDPRAKLDFDDPLTWYFGPGRWIRIYFVVCTALILWSDWGHKLTASKAYPLIIMYVNYLVLLWFERMAARHMIEIAGEALTVERNRHRFWREQAITALRRGGVEIGTVFNLPHYHEFDTESGLCAYEGCWERGSEVTS